MFLSIFYPENEWHVLFQKGIIPFLEKYQSQYLYGYILHFGKTRGDYIGLSCEVRGKEYHSFIQITHAFFTDFTGNFPVPGNNDKPAIGESVFMNFPANAVCHSLHQFLPIVPGNNKDKFLGLWYKSSIFCMNIYGNEPFDKEDFFTAVLYLSVLLLLSNQASGKKYWEKRANDGQSTADDPEYITQFKESETVLKEVLEDCLDILDGNIREDLQPVGAWFKVFDDFLRPFNNNTVQQAFLLEEILINLRKQLCIISDGQSFIDFCINKLISRNYALTPFE